MQNGSTARNIKRNIMCSGCGRREVPSVSETRSGWNECGSYGMVVHALKKASSRRFRRSVRIFGILLAGILILFGLVGAAETGAVSFPAACALCIVLLGSAACWLYCRYGFDG